MADLSPARVQALKDRIAKATRGPWRLERDSEPYTDRPESRRIKADGVAGSLMCDTPYYPWCPDSDADWELIANAPTDLADLLAALEAQGQELELSYLVPKVAVASVSPRYMIQGLEADYRTVSLTCLSCGGRYPHHEPQCSPDEDHHKFSLLLDAAERLKAQVEAQGQTIARLEQEKAEMTQAADAFAAGQISSGKLAEVLHCGDKHGFKTQAHAFDESVSAALAAKDAELARLTAERTHDIENTRAYASEVLARTWKDAAERTWRPMSEAPRAGREILDLKLRGYWSTWYGSWVDERGTTIYAKPIGWRLAAPPVAADAPKAQGRCETTQTERFENPACVCPTYAGNLGPCQRFEASANQRCVYCDHERLCPSAGLTTAADAPKE